MGVQVRIPCVSVANDSSICYYFNMRSLSMSRTMSRFLHNAFPEMNYLELSIAIAVTVLIKVRSFLTSAQWLDLPLHGEKHSMHALLDDLACLIIAYSYTLTLNCWTCLASTPGPQIQGILGPGLQTLQRKATWWVCASWLLGHAQTDATLS